MGRDERRRIFSRWPRWGTCTLRSSFDYGVVPPKFLRLRCRTTEVPSTTVGRTAVLAGGPLQSDSREAHREVREQPLDEIFGEDRDRSYEVSPRNQAEVNAASLREGRAIQIAVGATAGVPY
ncbi:MAG: hypothetical protein EA397_09390 [Deltaproteobacteria bacterium]|nr:MAG: hypothetical protein EA397_09390 [Deltaproteobacteria bacterium]